MLPADKSHDTSGLTYLNNRYHDPVLGVFTSVDPLVTTTHEPYIYAGSNPITYSDPSGLCIEPGTLTFQFTTDEDGNSRLRRLDRDQDARAGMRPDRCHRWQRRRRLRLRQPRRVRDRRGVAGCPGPYHPAWPGRCVRGCDVRRAHGLGCFGAVSNAAAVVAVACAGATLVSGGTSVACAGPAAGVSTVAAAAEVAARFVEDDPAAKCHLATNLVFDVLLPAPGVGQVTDAVFALTRGSIGAVAGAACE